MKKAISYTIVILFVIALFSCSNPTDTIKNKTWVGKIYRSYDNKELSEIKLKITEDTMYVFSNAIFGANNDTLFINTENKIDTVIVLDNKNSKNHWKLYILGTGPDNNQYESIALRGDGFYMFLHENSDDIFSEGSLDFYKNKIVAEASYMYLDKSWAGEIYRASDDQLLSEIKFKMKDDTVFIFSNAIFGSQYDTLLIKEYSYLDTAMILRSEELSDMLCSIYFDVDKNDFQNILLYGNGYYMFLKQSLRDVFDAGELEFYRNMNVPQDPDMYLYGAYEGYVEFENPMVELFSFSSLGPIKCKYVFLDGFRVREFGSASLFSESSITDYTIEGNIITLKSGGFFQIVDRGRKLVRQTDKVNIVLNKIY